MTMEVYNKPFLQSTIKIVSNLNSVNKILQQH